MKTSYSKLAGLLLIVGSLALTACGGGGGGSSAAPVAAANAVSGSSLQFGQGRWSNGLYVQNTSLYQSFLNNNGLCGIGYCNGSIYIMDLTLDTMALPGGMTPGLVNVSFKSPGNNQPNRIQTLACANASNNGLVINYYSAAVTVNPGAGLNYLGPNSGYLQINNLCQLAISPGQAPVFSVQVQWIDPNNRSTLQAQVYYQGSLMASGEIAGTVQNFGGIGYPVGYNPLYNGQNALVAYRQSGILLR